MTFTHHRGFLYQLAASIFLLNFCFVSLAQAATVALPPTINVLTNGVASGSMTSVAGKYYYFSITVPSGASSLAINTTGGSGDDDFYVKIGSQPIGSTACWFNAGTYTWSGSTPATNESVSITNPAAGTYYITVAACGAISNVTLKATYTVTGSVPANIAPTANAGADMAITLPTNSVAITGASAADADGSIASKVWTQTSGPSTATIANGTTFTPTFSGLLAGTYVFRLTATDNIGATGWDEMQVVVTPAPSTTPTPTLALPPSVNVLTNGIASLPMTVAKGSYYYFSIAVPSGASSLVINTTGGSGDDDFYVKLGSQPTIGSGACAAGNYTWSGSTPAVNESTTITNPVAGTYYISVAACGAISNITLKVTYPVSVPPPSTKFSLGSRMGVVSGPTSIRTTAALTGALLGTQPTDALGAIVGGPVLADGINWWNVNFDSGVDGWADENFLTATTTPVPPPPSTKFSINSRAAVMGGPTNIRGTASLTGALLGTQPTDALGTVTGGPTLAD
ncbi:MAG: Collagenase family protein, partial [Candidatus Giovannonibacteria bacterium GW2011_GWA2_53_7]